MCVWGGAWRAGRDLNIAYWLEEGPTFVKTAHMSVPRCTFLANSYPLPNLIPTVSLRIAVISLLFPLVKLKPFRDRGRVVRQVSRRESWPFSPTFPAACVVHRKNRKLFRSSPSPRWQPVRSGASFPTREAEGPSSSSGPVQGFHHCVPSTSLSARTSRVDRQCLLNECLTDNAKGTIQT